MTHPSGQRQQADVTLAGQGPNPPPFVGRERELAALAAALDSARRAAGRTILVGGEVGIGKTALIRRFVEEQLGAGQVWWGSTPVAAGQQFPFAPILEILRAVERENPAAVERLGELRRDLEPLLPGHPAVASTTPSDPFARQRLFESLRELCERLAADRPPLVLVLDDIHWADNPTLDVLSFLVHRLRDAAVLILAAYRSDWLEVAPALNRLLVELVRLDHVEHLELGGLEPQELLLLSSDAERRQVGQRVNSLAERSRGNPYLFRQLVEAGDAAGEKLPGQLRRLLLLRLEALPAEARTVAQIVAVAGGSATGRLLGAALPDRESLLLDALRALVGARVFDPPADSQAGYAFHHPLLHEAVLHDLLPEERAQLHRRVAAALEADPSLRRPGPAGTVEAAIHWSAARDPSHTLPALLEGAQAAQQLYAFELAHTFAEQALEMVRRSAREMTDLLLRTAEIAYLAGKPARAVELVQQARMSEQFDHSREHLALERIGWYQLVAGDVEAALEALRAAVEAAQEADDEPRGRVLASYGRALMLAGEYTASRSILEEAISCAKAAGSRSDESRALAALGSVLVRLGDYEAGNAKLDAAHRIDEQRAASLASPRPSRIGYILGTLLDRSTTLERTGQLEAAANEARGALEAAQRLGGTQAWAGSIAARAARQLFLLGRWTEADGVLDAVEQPPSAADRIELGVMRARLAAARGQLSDAIAALETAKEALHHGASERSIADLHVALAEAALYRDHPAQAREAIERALELIPGEDQIELAEAVSLGLQADAESAELAQLQRSGVESIREDALLLAARAGISARQVRQQRDAGRGYALKLLCAAELGRVNGALDAAQWRATADAFEAAGEPYNGALARLREAEALLARRLDRPRAEAALRLAHTVATSLGAGLLQRECEALARRSRLDLAPDRSSESDIEPGTVPARLRRELGLSPRELEVLTLVAEGRTNRQIAERLFITEKTAGHHVSSILTKLGLASRIEAAAVAHRHGLAELIGS